jgi:hypothetical protein
MSIHLLKIVGHEITISHWEQESKTLLWAACCLTFFGSFRIGKILPGGNSSKDFETLTWNWVHFTNKNSAIINIRFPKAMRKPQGDLK